jgi:hypothetical protein
MQAGSQPLGSHSLAWAKIIAKTSSGSFGRGLLLAVDNTSVSLIVEQVNSLPETPESLDPDSYS